MNAFSTRNVGLAALFRYLYTHAAHLRTLKDERGTVLEFNDIGGDCHAIMRQYQRFDGADGFAIADAKAFADEFFEVRRTMSAAMANGEWRNNAQTEEAN